jgi:hypothetical protein
MSMLLIDRFIPQHNTNGSTRAFEFFYVYTWKGVFGGGDLGEIGSKDTTPKSPRHDTGSFIFWAGKLSFL